PSSWPPTRTRTLPRPRWWRRWLRPAAAATSTATIGPPRCARRWLTGWAWPSSRSRGARLSGAAVPVRHRLCGPRRRGGHAVDLLRGLPDLGADHGRDAGEGAADRRARLRPRRRGRSRHRTHQARVSGHPQQPHGTAVSTAAVARLVERVPRCGGAGGRGLPGVRGPRPRRPGGRSAAPLRQRGRGPNVLQGLRAGQPEVGIRDGPPGGRISHRQVPDPVQRQRSGPGRALAAMRTNAAAEAQANIDAIRAERGRVAAALAADGWDIPTPRPTSCGCRWAAAPTRCASPWSSGAWWPGRSRGWASG
ncbi:hypothetical protein GBAR_LOCUS23485, partial [Geodia barretti]